MLTRFHKVLLGLLALQLVLVVVTALGSDERAVLEEKPLLAGFDAAKVTRLQVLTKAGKPIDLVKKGETWVLASSFDHPVEASKVNDVLSPIAKMAAAEPIATQKGRRVQLKVDDAEFERKLVITADGKDTTLFIGAAAGARRTAVRLNGDERVYGVTAVTAHAFGAEPRQWVDTKYFEVPKDEVQRVVIQRGTSTFEFARVIPPTGAGSGSAAGSAGSGAGAGSAPPPVGPAWTIAIDGAPLVPPAGEELNTDAVEAVVGNLALIHMVAPGDPKRDASKPSVAITIERKPTGATTQAPQVLELIEDGDQYWLRERGRDRAIMIAKGTLDHVTGVARERLVKKAEAPGAGSAAPPPQMPGGIPPGMQPPNLPPGFQ